ncbi:hypothetical protein VY88_04080 [Azospirillum thiophilum]|uniref:Uncharacterized protein n=1 Tax=Azospirillum thiophilum TaxID=528244 RepID=A0AAC8VX51_9PROT|nr:hypothetical protein [Azospirillum thiophilum]ALG70966.1 hypothetical protein AL072_08620 [Azospirillum thiophilum]KJR65371.1 hypothetical protein VY88_04080 [Azospirillum thiophilum]
MSTGSFPSDPGSRKAILVLQRHEVERCQYEPGAERTLVDDETYVLPLPLPVGEDSPQALRNLSEAGLLRPGAMLVQSPFNVDTYEEAYLAPQRFALAKHMYFSVLCRHLGATEVSVEQITLSTSKGEQSLDMKGSRLGAEGSVKGKAEDLAKVLSQMDLHDEFTGGPPDVTAAERLLRRTGLMGDPNMRSLIEMRRDGANQIKSRRVKVNLSSEAQSTLSVVGRLEVPKFVKISADYKRVVQERHDYQLTVLVKF